MSTPTSLPLTDAQLDTVYKAVKPMLEMDYKMLEEQLRSERLKARQFRKTLINGRKPADCIFTAIGMALFHARLKRQSMREFAEDGQSYKARRARHEAENWYKVAITLGAKLFKA